MILFTPNNNIGVKTKYFASNYEQEIINGNIRELHYIEGPMGLAAIYVKQGGNDTMYYTHTDHLGSITEITNNTGTLLQRMQYDAWGKRSFITNNIGINNFLFDRGYTGHEHLDQFSLINMNGRLYDPILGRMLSSDNFVQNPGSSQSFNRYSYVLNNPLKYTDPDGNWGGWDDLIVGGIGFAFGYVSYGIINDDWGWNAVGAGAIGAGTFLLGYYSGGATSAGNIAGTFSAAGLQGSANTVGLAYAGGMVASGTISSFVPPLNIPVGNNFSMSVSPGVSMGPGGITAGLNFSGTYTNDDWSLSAGYGISNTGYTVSGAIGYDGFSYYQNYFGGGSYNQTVGGIGIQKGDFSLRVENDMFAGRKDRWRTSAVEIGYKNFVIGTNILTNDPEGEGSGVDPNGLNMRGKLNNPGYGAWKNGQVYSAPLYVGYRNGNNVTRVGISAPLVQDRTQNFIHKNFHPGYTNFYNKYDYFRGGAYSYYGYYNPYTLY